MGMVGSNPVLGIVSHIYIDATGADFSQFGIFISSYVGGRSTHDCLLVAPRRTDYPIDCYIKKCHSQFGCVRTLQNGKRLKYSMDEIKVNCRDPKKHTREVADALQEFKKQIKKSGLMQELRRREHYVPPSKARRLKRSESLKQRKRDERKQEWQRQKEEF